jgi:small-conductance mechanosensitive channel
MTRLRVFGRVEGLAGLLAGLLAVLLAWSAVAHAAGAPTPAPAPRAETALSPQQAQQALSVLRDEAKRSEMISVLETIAKAAPAVADPPAAPPATAAAAGTPATGSATAAPAATAAAATVAPGTQVVVAPVVVAPPATTGQSLTPAAIAAAALAPLTGAKPASTAATAAPTPAAKLAIPLAPDSLGAELLVGASDRLESLSTNVSDTVRTLTNFTLLQRWVKAIAADPDSRAEMFDATWKLLVVTLAALAVERLVARLLRRPIRNLLAVAPADEPETAMPEEDPAQGRQRSRTRAVRTVRRLPLMLARMGLDLLPILAMAAVGYGLLGSPLGEQTTSKLVILALLNAYVLCRVVTVITRAILSPDAPGLRLLRLDDQSALMAVRWVRRIAVVALFGYALTEVALLFGLYRVAHDALLKLVALAVHLMLVLVVLQYRAPVARLIRPGINKRGMLAALRSRLAPVWHIVVIFYIIALWTVWALDVPGGFQKLLLIFVSTVIVANIARLLAVLLVAGFDNLTAQHDPKAKPRTPGVEAMIHRYAPMLRALIEAFVAITAILVLLQIWGVDTLSWFGSNALGGRLVSAMLTSGMTIGIALVIWEAGNAAAQNHLARLSRDGHPARAARVRTLLPMLRTTLLVVISSFALLTVLSEIGVNIAPLLAGASVIGLAIGFGSQKLVQDIITGLFLLMENTMQVGDVVTLGGLSGTVENLSIRTIRLRALDGSVHIIPFSAVTTVTNMTRDFAYALLDVSVGLNEEPDKISSVIEDVAEKMRAEPRWGAAISDRMEIMGVEKFIDTAWVLRCRLKTVPSQRWAVTRELNRRLKYRFDQDAIESPFTSYQVLSNAALPPPAASPVPEEGPGKVAA